MIMVILKKFKYKLFNKILALVKLPGLTVAAMASMSVNFRLDEFNAFVTTSSIFLRCKSWAIGGIMPPCLQ